MSIASRATTGVLGLRVHSAAPLTPRWLAASITPRLRELLTHRDVDLAVRQGWLGGPHVDLVQVGGEEVVDWAAVNSTLTVQEVDPLSRLSGADYLDQARELGRLEAVPPPYLPLADHGTRRLLRAADVQPRNPALRGVPEFAITTAAMTRPLIDTIDLIADVPRSATAALAQAMVALGDAHHLGLAFGAYSFRSHAEAFFAWSKARVDVRPRFEERRRRDAATFRAAIEQRLGTTADTPGQQWHGAFRYASGVLDSAVRTGTLSVGVVEAMTGAEDFAPLDEHSAPPRQRHAVDSDFHRFVSSSGVAADPAPRFASYRILLNAFYAQLPLLSVSPMQRYYLCYAIAETLDEVLGETWQERIAKVQLTTGASA